MTYEDELYSDTRPKQLEFAMALRGYSQAALARESGYHETKVRRIMQGYVQCDEPEFWNRIAEVLRCRWKGYTLVTIPVRRGDRVIEWEQVA